MKGALLLFGVGGGGGGVKIGKGVMMKFLFFHFLSFFFPPFFLLFFIEPRERERESLGTRLMNGGGCFFLSIFYLSFLFFLPFPIFSNKAERERVSRQEPD